MDHSPMINTRQFRSPEVILGYPYWNEKSDIWSAACLLLQLYTGELVFQTGYNLEHLAMIERFIGELPERMIEKATERTGFDKEL